jgi:hypothetical protein
MVTTADIERLKDEIKKIWEEIEEIKKKLE